VYPSLFLSLFLCFSLRRAYRIIGASSDPSTNRRRGGSANNVVRVTSLARRRRSLAAGRRTRKAAPRISTAEDISSRDCGGTAAAERQRLRPAPTETPRSHWRRRRSSRRAIAAEPCGDIWRRAPNRDSASRHFAINSRDSRLPPSSDREVPLSRYRGPFPRRFFLNRFISIFIYLDFHIDNTIERFIPFPYQCISSIVCVFILYHIFLIYITKLSNILTDAWSLHRCVVSVQNAA